MKMIRRGIKKIRQMVDNVKSAMKELWEMLFPPAMNEVSSTAKCYREISDQTEKWFYTLVSIYLILNANNIDLFAPLNNWISTITSDIVRAVVQIISMFLSVDLLYKVLKKISKSRYCHRWKKEHRNIWVDGLWLHVHEKQKPRVGVVKIEQDFYTIRVHGHNVRPDPNDLDESTWDHVLGGILDNSRKDFLMGYYESRHGLDRNDGIHNFCIEYSGDGQMPTTMSGDFRDVVKENQRSIKDAVGQIYLYRLTEDVPYYDLVIDANGKIRYDELAKVHSVHLENLRADTSAADPVKRAQAQKKLAAYEQDPYIRKLLEVLKDHPLPQTTA